MKNNKYNKSIFVAIGNLALIGLLAGCGKNNGPSEVIQPSTQPTNAPIIEDAAASKNELLQMINQGDQIEIEVAVPDFVEQEQGEQNQLVWIELGNLNTNDTLRSAWDDILLITKTETGKNGVLYVNDEGINVNNNTLQMALHNRAFAKYLDNEDGIATLAEGSINNYADLEADEEYKAVLMGINGYFNLLPDATPNYCNADTTVTRNEYLAMVFRAESPVQEIEADMNYETAVGSSDLNVYAQGVVQNSYLGLSDKSLNNMTANGSITRAEVIYTLVNRYYSDELANVDIKSVTFDDCKDGGDIASQQKFFENGAAKDYCDSYELTYALANPDAGCPTDLYKALVVAHQVGILDSTETRWDEAATLSEVVEFIMNAHINDDSIATFNFNQGTISGYEAPEEEKDFEDLTDEEKSDINENDSQFEEGLPDVEEPAEEDEETPAENPSGEQRNSVPENEVQWYLDTFGWTRAEFNAKTDAQLQKILMDYFANMGGSGGDDGGSSGGNNGGGDNSGGGQDDQADTGGLAPLPLDPDDGRHPGNM